MHLGVGRGRPLAQRPSHANGTEHEPDLSHQGVGEKPSVVAGRERVEDGVDRHPCSEQAEERLAREEEGEGEHRRLRGVRPQQHRPRGTRLGIGIREPGGERPDGRVHGEPEEDQPGRQPVPPEGQHVIAAKALEGEERSIPRQQCDAAEEHHPAEEVDEEVAERHARGVRGTRREDHARRRQGHPLPAHEEGQPPAREDDEESAARIQEPRGSLGPIVVVPGVDSPEQGGKPECPSEHLAQPGHVEQLDTPLGERDAERAYPRFEAAELHQHQGCEDGHGQPAKEARQERDGDGADDQDQARGQGHRDAPLCSTTPSASRMSASGKKKRSTVSAAVVPRATRQSQGASFHPSAPSGEGRKKARHTMGR